jgi:hypothetical protein
MTWHRQARSQPRISRRTAAVAGAVVIAMLLAACGSGTTNTGGEVVLPVAGVVVPLVVGVVPLPQAASSIAITSAPAPAAMR